MTLMWCFSLNAMNKYKRIFTVNIIIVIHKMGSTISMDVNAAAEIAELVTRDSDKENAPDTQFEDALRQEVLLVPEDMEDIHIQATAPAAASDADAAVATDATATDPSAADTPANNTRNAAGAAAVGKGKHWKRNLKKKQQVEQHATERTQEQRRDQIRPIIEKLTELQMNVSYPAIRELYKVLNQYVKTGEDTKIKIPFPEFSRKIKGELSNAPYIPCWVKLEMD
jgi:hypothetical protein